MKAELLSCIMSQCLLHDQTQAIRNKRRGLSDKMSASREKKQRQDTPEQKLTQKQIKEQKEAREQKRKTIIYTVIGVVVAVLVAALLIWHSGFFQSRTTAVTVNGHNYTPTDVSYYYYQALNTEYMMAQYGMSAFAPSVDPKEQYTTEEQTATYHDKFMQSAMNSLVKVTALLDAAEAEGFSDDAAVQEYVDTQLSSIDSTAASYNYSRASYIKAMYGRYMTEGRFKQCLEREGLAEAYKNAHEDSLTYDDADLEKYYTEHKDELDTFSYDVCFINGAAANPVDEEGNPLTDEEGNTVTATDEEKAQAMEAARQSAEELVTALAEGGAFAQLALVRADADEKSSYSGDQSTVGSSLSTTYSEWLTSADRTAGDVETFEIENSGVYVVRFNGRERAEDAYATVDVRHILIKAETTDTDETDSNGNPIPSDEAMEAAKAKAQELLDQWKAGEATAESFGELANEYSDDPGSNTNGGLYQEVPRNQFFTEFNDWMFDTARKPGDTELIENTQSGQQGWHVVYLEKQGELLWRSTAEDSLRSDDMSAWTKEIESGYSASEGSGIVYVGDQ